ncbi:MAG TPA: hypothetical protein VNC16_02560 [Solirubrobacterales bacterium]|nr:hypothetical protein [Solirubrobacterales bacterium]
MLDSIGAMLLFAYLLGQVLGLPEVENPIPEKIGVADVFALAGACGVVGGVVRFRSPSFKQDQGARWGVFAGFFLGVAAYLLLLLLQLISKI